MYLLKFATVAKTCVLHVLQFQKNGVSHKVAGKAGLSQYKYLHITVEYKLHIVAVLRDSLLIYLLSFKSSFISCYY